MRSMTVLFCTIAWCIAASAQSTVTVTGFENGKYSIVENPGIEQQLSAAVIPAIANTITAIRAQGKTVAIKVTGYASRDKADQGRLNDDVSWARANAIAQSLRYSFPGIEIDPVPGGSRANARIVVVEWKIVPMPGGATAPAPKDAKTPSAVRMGIASAFTIGMTLLAVFFFAKRRRRQTATHPPTEPALPAQREPHVEYYHCGDYLVPITKIGDEFVTPFPNKEDPSTLNKRPTRQEARKVVQLFMKRLFDKPAVQELIANGTIRKVEP